MLARSFSRETIRPVSVVSLPFTLGKPVARYVRVCKRFSSFYKRRSYPYCYRLLLSLRPGYAAPDEILRLLRKAIGFSLAWPASSRTKAFRFDLDSKMIRRDSFDSFVSKRFTEFRVASSPCFARFLVIDRSR